MTYTTLDSGEPGAAGAAHAAGEISLMPGSRAARAAVWLVLAALGALVFAAWLRPNMIFDLADMVFCN